MSKNRRGLFPFIKKEKYFNNPTKVKIHSILGENRQKRVMFLLEDNGDFIVTDFKREVFYQLKSWFGSDIKNWINKEFVLEAEKWTSNTHTLRVKKLNEEVIKSSRGQKGD